MTNEQLVVLIQDGIDEAENMRLLWQQNQGFIGKLAMIYSGQEELDDLKQEGYLALCDAVRGYDAVRGVPLSTMRRSGSRQGCGGIWSRTDL
ncbi:MAG: hypothetical protein ACLTNO_07330 [Blautia sp.]